MEVKSAESIRRLEAVIAGTHSKGIAGENILDAVFSMLPVEWQVRIFA
jgi:DNA recombination protein RmuC